MSAIIVQGNKFNIEGDTPTPDEQAAIRKALGVSEEGNEETFNLAGEVNVGVARGVGSLVDLSNMVLSIVGLGSEDPAGGSKQLESAVRSTQFAADQPQEPGTGEAFAGRVGQEFGATLMPFAAVGAAVRAGRAGGPLKSVFDFFKNRPGTFAATEGGAAVTAGAGAAIANQAFPENELADITGQVVGGFMTPGKLIAERSPQAIASLKRTMRTLFTKEGAKDIAAQIVQKSARDLEGSKSILSGDAGFVSGSKVPATRETGDAGLLALEKSAMRKSEELKDGIGESIAETNRRVTLELESLGGTTGSQSTKQLLEDKLTYLKGLLDTRSQQAVNSAKLKLGRLSPSSSRETANRVVRKELDEAYSAATTQEGDLWNAVDKTLPANVDGTRSTFARILANRDRLVENPEDIPGFVRGWFRGKNAIKGRVTTGRVQAMRKRVLAEMRAERGKEVPNRNKVRILGELQASLADDTMAIVDDPDIRLARAFSRDLNERFRQGSVGDLLGFEKTGEITTPPALTLESIAGRQGPAAGVGIDDIRSATGVQTSPQDLSFQRAEQAAVDFIRDRFLRSSVDPVDNTVRVASARRFLNENAEILSRHPEVKTQIEEAITDQGKAERLIKSGTTRIKNLQNKTKTAASVFINAPVDKEIKRVLSSSNPGANMRSLVRSAIKDKSGEAIAGLRAGVIDEIFSASTSKTKDINQANIVSGERMLDFIKKNRKAIIESGVLSSQQVSRLNRVARTSAAMERKLSTGFVGQELLDDSPDSFTDMIMSIVGANIGGASALGQASGAPLVLAGRGAEAARSIGRRFTSKIPISRVSAVINEAIQDRDLMLELLKRPKTIKQALEHERALRGFLINIVPELQKEDDLPENR